MLVRGVCHKGWNVQPPTATKIQSKILNCIQWIHSLDMRWGLILDILLTSEHHHYHQIYTTVASTLLISGFYFLPF